MADDNNTSIDVTKSLKEGNNRDEDNGLYYGAGVGLRYAIQQKAGVDLHLDVVTNNDGETSVYVGVNQAF